MSDTTISIPTALAAQVAEKMQRKGFSTLSSYVTHLLRKDAEAADITNEAAVKERLKSLGYLD